MNTTATSRPDTQKRVSAEEIGTNPVKREPGIPFKEGNAAAVGHGAPAGNTNSVTHGLRTTTLGRLPDHKITWRANKFRRWLESWTLQTHGKISVKHELAINSAARHEIAAMLINRWLRLRLETMTHDQRLKFVTALGRESDLRDRAVDRLNLDRDTTSIVESLYASVVPQLEDHDHE
jgi:hypothetical protein